MLLFKNRWHFWGIGFHHITESYLKKNVSVFDLEKKILEKKKNRTNFSIKETAKQSLEEHPITYLFICCLIS